MGTAETTTSLYFYPKRSTKLRLFALWYFAILLTLWVVLGHLVLGFEQSWLQSIVGIVSACIVQWLLEWVDATSNGRKPRYAGRWFEVISFLLPAWISGLAVSMLLYPNDQLAPIAFAAALSIASKVLFRAPVGNRSTHFFNPSNFGVTLTLLLLPSVGLAPPYQFTENVVGIWNWILPSFLLLTGLIVHAYFCGRLILCSAWITGFILQAGIRSWYWDIPWQVPLIPMTSTAFVLFTLYMVPDPATSPLSRNRQMIFGFSVAAVYSVLLELHVVYGLFLALWIVCAVRGAGLYLMAMRSRATSLSHTSAA